MLHQLIMINVFKLKYTREVRMTSQLGPHQVSPRLKKHIEYTQAWLFIQGWGLHILGLSINSLVLLTPFHSLLLPFLSFPPLYPSPHLLLSHAHLVIRYSMVSTRTLGGRSSLGLGTWWPAPALTYSFTAKLELLTALWVEGGSGGQEKCLLWDGHCCCWLIPHRSDVNVCRVRGPNPK